MKQPEFRNDVPPLPEDQVPIPKLVQLDRTTSPRGYPFKTFDQMAGEVVSKPWLIKGIIARGETSAWIAPPGGLKSALMASLAISVSSGQDWFGHRNKGAAAVVYFAIERADLVRRRLKAHGVRRNLQGLPIVVVSSTIDLAKPDAWKKVVATIREVEAALGVSVGLVIFDTFAKLVAASGGDENSARDQGVVFANLQQVKNETKIHAALVGHTGKDETKGSRGSNAILGDVDVMISVLGDVHRTATVIKANDAPEGPLFSFTSEVHDFGPDEDGDPITVNIVSTDEVELQVPGERKPKLSANQRVMFRLLYDAGARGLTVDEWNDQGRELDIGKARKAILWELKCALKDKGLVREYAGRWTVAHE